jgi:hypothetical protein
LCVVSWTTRLGPRIRPISGRRAGAQAQIFLAAQYRQLRLVYFFHFYFLLLFSLPQRGGILTIATEISTSEHIQCGPAHHVRSCDANTFHTNDVLAAPTKLTRNPRHSRQHTAIFSEDLMSTLKIIGRGRTATVDSEKVLKAERMVRE